MLGGAVLGGAKWIEDVLQPFIRNTGPSLSPFNAWVLLKGLETLPPARRGRLPQRRSAWRISWRASPSVAPRLVSRPRRPSAACAGDGADERPAARW